jgi:hypothetical protein
MDLRYGQFWCERGLCFSFFPLHPEDLPEGEWVGEKAWNQPVSLTVLGRA